MTTGRINQVSIVSPAAAHSTPTQVREARRRPRKIKGRPDEGPTTRLRVSSKLALWVEAHHWPRRDPIAPAEFPKGWSTVDQTRQPRPIDYDIHPPSRSHRRPRHIAREQRISAWAYLQICLGANVGHTASCPQIPTAPALTNANRDSSSAGFPPTSWQQERDGRASER